LRVGAAAGLKLLATGLKLLATGCKLLAAFRSRLAPHTAYRLATLHLPLYTTLRLSFPACRQARRRNLYHHAQHPR